ncbi:MAG TPA: YciI family protein [Thermoanaerobaculia bacterium]
MKYLLLIHLNEDEMAALPHEQMNDLNVRHLTLNDDLRQSGHFIEAEALQPGAQTSTLRVQNGKVTVMDGPFTETKELVAGFYLVEAKDQDEAVEIARRLPSLPHGWVEVRPCRQLEVD